MRVSYKRISATIFRLQLNRKAIREDRACEAMQTDLGGNDPKLSGFILAQTDSMSQRALERIMATQTEPIRQIVRARRRGYQVGSQEAEDIHDLCGSAVVEIVRRLHECRGDPHRSPIRDLDAYVGKVTVRVCNDHLARTRPHWGLAYSRLRSAARNNPQFTFSVADRGSAACGLAQWPAAERADAHDPRLQDLQRAPERFVQSTLGNLDPTKLSPVELLTGFLQWVGRPVELTSLVLPACAIWKLDAMSVCGDECEGYEQAPAAQQRISALIVLRDRLSRLWAEIEKLPLLQRTAFLLNMQDSQQRYGIELFAITNVARLSEIADAVNIPYDEFLALWSDLPLSDMQLAGRLGVTATQVNGLRKSARERLGRFLRSIDRT